MNEYQKLLIKELTKISKQLRKEAIEDFKTYPDFYFSNITLEEFTETYDGMIEDAKMLHDMGLGAEDTRWSNEHNRTLFHSAAFFGLSRQIKLSLQKKEALSSYNQKDDLGFTPLDYAESQGHEKIVELIKEFENTRVKRGKK